MIWFLRIYDPKNVIYILRNVPIFLYFSYVPQRHCLGKRKHMWDWMMFGKLFLKELDRRHCESGIRRWCNNIGINLLENHVIRLPVGWLSTAMKKERKMPMGAIYIPLGGLNGQRNRVMLKWRTSMKPFNHKKRIYLLKTNNEIK